MSSVRLRTPPAEDWGLTEGEPVVAEILDENLDLVDRVSLKTGSDQVIDVPVGSFVVRVRLPDGHDLITQAASAAEEGRWAASMFLRKVADWLEPEKVAVSQGPLGAGDSIRKGISEVVAKIADSPVRERRSMELPAVRGLSVEPTAELHVLLRSARMALWARDEGDWRRADSGRIHPLGDGRFLLALNDQRMYALQVGGRSLPWRIVLLPPTDLEVRVAPSPSQSQLDAGIGVRVVLQNPGAEATLRYMEVGATQEARLVAEPLAEDLLRSKQIDVTGAVVGGYCLLRTGGYERLHDWPNNLANWYPWLPDSAVIHAWQLLEEPGAPSFSVAQGRLLQAERAGLPIFSEGLMRLYDGLILFRDDPEQPQIDLVDDAVKRLDPYMASASLQHTYTTYYGTSPYEPSLEAVLGDVDAGVDVIAKVSERSDS